MLERRCDFCHIRMLHNRQHFTLSDCQILVQPHTKGRSPKNLDLCESCLAKQLENLVAKLEKELANNGT